MTILVLDVSSKIMNGLPEETLSDALCLGRKTSASHFHTGNEVARDCSNGLGSSTPQRQERVCTSSTHSSHKTS